MQEHVATTVYHLCDTVVLWWMCLWFIVCELSCRMSAPRPSTPTLDDLEAESALG